MRGPFALFAALAAVSFPLAAGCGYTVLPVRQNPDVVHVAPDAPAPPADAADGAIPTDADAGPCGAPSLDLCGGSCVDTRSDPAHCGACGHACDPRPNAIATGCSTGVCVYQCEPGFSTCGGDIAALGCPEMIGAAPGCGSCSDACDGTDGFSCRGVPNPPSTMEGAPEIVHCCRGVIDCAAGGVCNANEVCVPGHDFHLCCRQ